MMSKSKLMAGAYFIAAVVLVPGVSWPVHAQDGKTMYLSMAPVDQYLMDRDAEIALARSAAPESISGEATIMVLGPHGYEKAVEGKNGFVCDVERSWMSPFKAPYFWSDKIRAPVCYNPAAARFILPIIKKRTELALAGRSQAQMLDELTAAYAKKLPVLEPGAMSYMMSPGAVLDGGGNQSHLMFYTPPDAKWGAEPGSPVLNIQQGAPEGFSLFMISLGQWSDGTPTPLPTPAPARKGS